MEISLPALSKFCPALSQRTCKAFSQSTRRCEAGRPPHTRASRLTKGGSRLQSMQVGSVTLSAAAASGRRRAQPARLGQEPSACIRFVRRSLCKASNTAGAGTAAMKSCRVQRANCSATTHAAALLPGARTKGEWERGHCRAQCARSSSRPPGARGQTRSAEKALLPRPVRQELLHAAPRPAQRVNGRQVQRLPHLLQLLL